MGTQDIGLSNEMDASDEKLANTCTQRPSSSKFMSLAPMHSCILGGTDNFQMRGKRYSMVVHGVP